MSALFHEILQQERARLLRSAANLFALPKSETDLADLFTAADKLQLHRLLPVLGTLSPARGAEQPRQ